MKDCKNSVRIPVTQGDHPGGWWVTALRNFNGVTHIQVGVHGVKNHKKGRNVTDTVSSIVNTMERKRLCLLKVSSKCWVFNREGKRALHMASVRMIGEP